MSALAALQHVCTILAAESNRETGLVSAWGVCEVWCYLGSARAAILALAFPERLKTSEKLA